MCRLSIERSLFMTILLGIFTTISLVGFLVAFFARPLDLKRASPTADIADEENTDGKIAAQMGDRLVLIFGIVFGLLLAATILFACCFWSAIRYHRKILKHPDRYFRLTCQLFEFPEYDENAIPGTVRRDPESEASREVEEVESGSISASVYGSVTENGEPEEFESGSISSSVYGSVTENGEPEDESGSISSSVYCSVTENGESEEPESEADALIHRRVRGNEESEEVETEELESVELETEM